MFLLYNKLQRDYREEVLEEMMKNLEKLKSGIVKIAKKHRLKLVILYGSRATNQAKKDSDIDIAILGEESIDFKEHLEIINDFVKLFQTDKIDVKLLHYVDPLFRFQVMRDGILLCGSKRDFVSFRAYAFRDYMDSQSLFRLKRNFIEKRMKFVKEKSHA